MGSVLILEESGERVAAAMRLLSESGYRVEMAAGDARDEIPTPHTGSTNAVLDALPAQIAQLDADGFIVSVNDAWRNFDPSHAIHSGDGTRTHNYLSICEGATGEGSEDARAAGDGIRRVLRHELPDFIMEYPCHTPTQQRWYRLHVTPLRGTPPSGAVVMHLDITERKLAENRLRRSEANLAASQRIAHLGSWELDLVNVEDLAEGALRWSNEVFRIWGYRPGEIEVTYENFLAAVHPDDRDLIGDAVNAALRESRAYDLTHRIRRPDGTERIVREQAEFQFDPASGEPVRMIGTVLDVTEQRRAEQAITRALERLNEAQRIAQIGDWEWDLETQSIFWSPQIYDIFGRDARLGPPTGIEELLGFYDRPSRTVHNEKISLVLSTGEEQRYELVVVRSDGRRVNVQALAVARKDGHGKITALYGTVQDISARKHAEASLATSEQRLALATQAVRMGVWDWDIASQRQIWNPQMYALHGVTQEQFDHSFDSWNRTLHPDDRERARSEIDAALAGTHEVHTEYRTLLPNGDIRFIESHGLVRTDEDGVPVRMLGVDWDITERKRLEQQILRAQRLDSIGTMAGGIAHDLNNTFVPIVLCLELLKARSPDRASHDLINTVHMAVQRGAAMVRQVLSFARGIEGLQIDVNLAEVLREVATIANDTFLKQIAVNAQIPSDLWSVKGDPTQLHQVLLNLCVNARDAMPNGGQLFVSAENIRLDEHYVGHNIDASVGPFVLVQVEDTGHGMAPEVIEKIFDPFFTTKEIGKGTGIGLTTSLAIVKHHGGFIDVYSAPGKGTKFKIYLPAQNYAAPASIALDTAAIPRGLGELILVLDDEEAVREATRQTLEAFGYAVLTAASGREVITILGENHPKIAAFLTDMMLPGVDGLAVIRGIRTIDPAIPIIAMSGLSAGNDAKELSELGVTQFLTKPFTAESLLLALDQMLRPRDRGTAVRGAV